MTAPGLAHQGGDVHLAHGGGVVLAAGVAARHIAQGAAAGEVRDGVAGRVLQHIVGHADQRVFLAEHLAGLADQCQAVDVGVDDDAQVAVVLAHAVADLREVLRDGFGVMGEMARGLAVELHDVLHAEAAQQARDGEAASRVHGVDGNLEASLLDGFDIHQLQTEHTLDMAVNPVLLDGHLTEVVDLGIVDFAAVSETQHLLALGVGDELALAVQQLEGVPVLGVVAGGDDDAAVAVAVDDGHLGGRRGAQAGLQHVDTHALQGAHHEAVHHGTAQTRVASHSQSQPTAGVGSFEESGKSGSELNDVEGCETLACGSADGAADSRDRFDKRHIILLF